MSDFAVPATSTGVKGSTSCPNWSGDGSNASVVAIGAATSSVPEKIE